MAPEKGGFSDAPPGLPQKTEGPRDGLMPIYAMESEDGRLVKIGYSEDAAKRLLELRVANPGLRLIGVASGNRETERDLHVRFAGSHYDGEWFHAEAPEIREFARGLEPLLLPMPCPRKLGKGRRHRHKADGNAVSHPLLESLPRSKRAGILCARHRDLMHYRENREITLEQALILESQRKQVSQ
jgi:T5orf172 domain